MTLQQIAETTKISIPTLRHIERNELDQLPGVVFTKGFLRAYAAEVGVNPEEVVEEFRAQIAAQAAAQAAAEQAEVPEPIGMFEYIRPHLPMAAAAIAVALFAYLVLRGAGGSPPVTPAEAIVAPPPIASAATGTAGFEAPPTAALAGRDIALEIQPTGACWVSVVADGQVVVYRLLGGGERVAATARGELVLRVGDPRVFAYTLNGVPGRPLGEGGQPVTVQITQDNYQTFLADPVPEPRADVSARAS
jgi:cytoskeletal protein RodZ